MTTTEAVILAIVEGLTEYLPVSSTGHLILTEAFLGMQKNAFTNMYIINVQFGAILAVLFLYWKRFFQSLDFYFKLFVAFLPAAVLGFLLNDFIDSLLSSVITVAVSLIIGGIVLIFTDRYFQQQIEEAAHDEEMVEVKEVNEFGIEVKKKVLKKISIGWAQAFIIGCFQCIAMIPGVSRSASTIIGGLYQKLNIKRAAEFSFFLAVPTITAASIYKLYKGIDLIRGTDIQFILIGNAISFIVGVIAIKFFINLITKYGLSFFGYYRIALGVAILVAMAMGYKLEITE
jgi:undecaprenyl-diphosphatase